MVVDVDDAQFHRSNDSAIRAAEIRVAAVRHAAQQKRVPIKMAALS